MPRLAIFLAVLNVLAAGGFFYLASIDYEMRQQWSYEVFRHELTLEGLPVDQKDVGRRVDQAIYPDAQRASEQLFDESGAGEFVRTQEEEVQRARNKIKDDLDKLNPTKRREALRQLFVAQARTIEEREAINKDFADPKNTTDKLQDRFLGRFDELANEQVGDEADKIQSINRRRTEIAHLLYNLPSGTNRQEALLAHQRLMIVIGQRAFVREAEAQALALREIAHRIQLLTVDDRELFERQYGAQRDRALYLAYELTRKQKELADTNTRIASSTDQIEGNAEKKIQGRKNQIKELNELLAKTTEETEKALKEQHDLEQRLFDLHKEVGSLIDANRKLEREIRNQELGRTRGGRP